MSELRDDALEYGDEMSLKLYVEEQGKREKKYKEGRATEIISFGTIFVFSIEWYFSTSNGSSRILLTGYGSNQNIVILQHHIILLDY
ncbi:hypothetical protein L2X67_22755 [Enterobacter ludwigii]|nr:hypothetical protein [Enterobacter ludwigii]